MWTCVDDGILMLAIAGGWVAAGVCCCAVFAAAEFAGTGVGVDAAACVACIIAAGAVAAVLLAGAESFGAAAGLLGMGFAAVPCLLCPANGSHCIGSDEIALVRITLR